MDKEGWVSFWKFFVVAVVVLWISVTLINSNSLKARYRANTCSRAKNPATCVRSIGGK